MAGHGDHRDLPLALSYLIVMKIRCFAAHLIMTPVRAAQWCNHNGEALGGFFIILVVWLACTVALRSFVELSWWLAVPVPPACVLGMIASRTGLCCLIKWAARTEEECRAEKNHL